MTYWYTTIEAVERELDVAGARRDRLRIARKIAASSQLIESLTLRRFYPMLATRYVDWPNEQHARSWRLYFEQPDQLVSLTSLTAGGSSIVVGDVNPEPANSGPPYSRLEIDRSSSAAWSSGTTPQRSIAITGIWGYQDASARAGTLAEALDSSETAVDVSDSAAIGIGSIIRVEDERMVVTGKTMLTTGQTLQTTALTAVASDVTVNVTTGTAYALDETIMIDAERMVIEEITGNALTVRRAQGGSVLAAHSVGTTIYAPRTLTVRRGELGTTAASHLTATAITCWVPPTLIEELCVAETCNALLQGSAAWGRVIGSGENAREFRGTGLKDIRERARERHGRRARAGVI
jgi:hypothetical protein